MCWHAALARGMSADTILLAVYSEEQRLYVLEAGVVTRSFAVSTSAKGLGRQRDSYQTPMGFHRVAERYGDDAPLGTVFRHRKTKGRVLPPEAWRGTSREDLILSRILRLTGLEPGINQGGLVDTYKRNIYLHGTNHEDRIGQPTSTGCIRMNNVDIRDLFEHTEGRETWCWIGTVDDQAPASD